MTPAPSPHKPDAPPTRELQCEVLFVSGGDEEADEPAAPTGPEAPSATGSPSAASSSSLAAVVLAAHNEQRLRVKVPPLRWDPDLEVIARRLADLAATTGEWCEDPNTDPSQYNAITYDISATLPPAQAAAACCRQCVAQGARCAPWAPVTEDLLDEASGFLQMVWSATTALGAAHASGPSGSVVVMVYAPPGNIVGELPWVPETAHLAGPSGPPPVPRHPGPEPPPRSPPSHTPLSPSFRSRPSPSDAAGAFREAMLAGHPTIRRSCGLANLEWSGLLAARAQRLVDGWATTRRLPARGSGVLQWTTGTAVDPATAARQCTQAFKKEVDAGVNADYSCLLDAAVTHLGAAYCSSQWGTFVVAVYQLPKPPGGLPAAPPGSDGAQRNAGVQSTLSPRGSPTPPASGPLLPRRKAAPRPTSSGPPQRPAPAPAPAAPVGESPPAAGHPPAKRPPVIRADSRGATGDHGPAPIRRSRPGFRLSLGPPPSDLKADLTPRPKLQMLHGSAVAGEDPGPAARVSLSRPASPLLGSDCIDFAAQRIRQSTEA